MTPSFLNILYLRLVVILVILNSPLQQVTEPEKKLQSWWLKKIRVTSGTFVTTSPRSWLCILISMDNPGIEVCRSRLDLHTSTLDLCRSRLDVCRSKVMHTNLRFLALWHCQKFRNLFLKQNVKFFFLNSVYKLPKLTILNISMFQLGPM